MEATTTARIYCGTEGINTIDRTASGRAIVENRRSETEKVEAVQVSAIRSCLGSSDMDRCRGGQEV